MLPLLLRNADKHAKHTKQTTQIEEEFTFDFYFEISNMKIPSNPWSRNLYLFTYCKNEEQEKTLLYIYYSFFHVSHNEFTIFRKLHLLLKSAQKKDLQSLFLSFFEDELSLCIFVEDWISNNSHIFVLHE